MIAVRGSLHDNPFHSNLEKRLRPVGAIPVDSSPNSHCGLANNNFFMFYGPPQQTFQFGCANLNLDLTFAYSSKFVRLREMML